MIQEFRGKNIVNLEKQCNAYKQKVLLSIVLDLKITLVLE